MTYFPDMDSVGRWLTPGVHVTLGGFINPQSFEEARAIEQLEKRHYSYAETRRILIERMEQAEKERREMYACEARECMLLSEEVLAREWDTPEEDAAWSQLEREADEDLATGRYTEYTNIQALIDDLTPDGEPDPHAAPTGDLAPGQEREDDV